MDYKKQLEKYRQRRERIIKMAEKFDAKEIARRLGITPQRVYQILGGRHGAQK